MALLGHFLIGHYNLTNDSLVWRKGSYQVIFVILVIALGVLHTLFKRLHRKPTGAGLPAKSVTEGSITQILLPAADRAWRVGSSGLLRTHPKLSPSIILVEATKWLLQHNYLTAEMKMAIVCFLLSVCMPMATCSRVSIGETRLLQQNLPLFPVIQTQTFLAFEGWKNIY